MDKMSELTLSETDILSDSLVESKDHFNNIDSNNLLEPISLSEVSRVYMETRPDIKESYVLLVMLRHFA